MIKVLKNIAKVIVVAGISMAVIAADNIYNSTEDAVSTMAANEIATVESKDNSKLGESGKRIISWGDSITYGLGSGDGSVDIDGQNIDITEWAYTDALEYYTGMDVYNLGVCGETSYEIALRQGGIGMYVDKSVTVRAGDRKSTRLNSSH